MSERTSIEWTDATWNPITGCSVVSAGCKHCYAMKLAGTRLQHHPSRAGLTIDTKAGPVWNGEVRLNEQWLDQPLRWRRPRRIFVCAHGDLFHERAPDEWIDRVFAVMALASHHTFQVLTKRPERMRAYLQRHSNEIREDFFGSTMARALISASRAAGHALPGNAALELLDNDDGWRAHPGSIKRTPGWPMRHVWLGVSVEDQDAANERIPSLLATPAAVRWLSCEPLLGAIELTALERQAGLGVHEFDALECDVDPEDDEWTGATIDWVVVGGESGTGARPMHPHWAQSLRDQCAEAGVPLLFKQWGEHMPADADDCDAGIASDRLVWSDGIAWDERDGQRGGVSLMARVGKKRAGRELDGRTHDEYPAQDSVGGSPERLS